MEAINKLLAEALRCPEPGAPPAPRLEYPFTPPPSDGSVREVAPGLLWARMPMPMALDHINVYLLRGTSGWTVVDTGLNTEAARACWERIAREQFGGLPVEALICSHFHYDHAGLASWFGERFQAPLYMTLGEFMTMRVMNLPRPEQPAPAACAFYHAAGMPAAETRRIFDALRADPFMAPQAPAYRRLRGGQVLDIGGRAWRVVIGEGHSPEHACLYCEEDGLLIAGDQLLPGITSNVMVSDIEPEGDPLQGWLDSLDRLDACRGDTLVLPSHQNAFRGLHARTGALRQHHLREFAVLLACLEQHGSRSAFEAMGTLFPKLRGAADVLMALGETLAHLAWLRRRGWVDCRLDDDGVRRFVRAAGPFEQHEVHW